MTERHSLAERDVERRTATCSACGPVKIQRAGNGWTCGTRANAQSRKQKRKNPDRDRESKTEHTLVAPGVCAKCGPVNQVANGRGWMCAKRAAELGRVNHQDKPQGYCRDCQILDGDIVWLTSDGCPRCLETSLHAMFAKDAADERLMADFDDWGEQGLHLVGMADPYSMADYESAVPGWKTIGQPA